MRALDRTSAHEEESQPGAARGERPSSIPRRSRGRRRSILGAAIVVPAVLFGAAAVHVHAVRAAPAAADDNPVSILVDLEARTLYIRNGDSTVESFPVAIGRGSKPTPAGEYTIRKIVWNPEWIPPDKPWAKGKKPQPPGAEANPMRLVKIFFKEPDYYIHGTNEPESVGEAASHGCLRMVPDDAYTVARYLMEHGGAPRDESWFWRVLHFRSETKTVYLDNPVHMTVE